ncbi:MAG TPA: glycosyltransferase family 39 protein [Xanthobacteraceae bacterium]|nr:glycosyltransferase family 39 protein [Xanthobacteraceae bacterium]
MAGGYFDHPPMIAYVIRLGTLIAGDTELGVRLVGVVLALPASWALWRAGAILFHDERLGATAALFFNLTLMTAAGMILAIPDCPLLAASALVLFCLAKLGDSNNGAWWLAAGAAIGAALLSKYNALFFGLSILVWVLTVPGLRRWLATPWPWLGAAVAFGLFMPVVMWNASHNWDSFILQFGRLAQDEFMPGFVLDYVASQIGLATPPVFVLAFAALIAFLNGRRGSFTARVLLSALVWPLILYLTWHSLHSRVDGNWAAPVYPALCVAAAAAAHAVAWDRLQTVIGWLKRDAAPVGLAMAAVVYLQAEFGIVPLGAADPTARVLAVGWRALGAEIDAVRLTSGAPVVLTTDYGLTAWLSFYLPSHAPVVQINERFRWVNEPVPSPDLFAGTMIYVCHSDFDIANDVLDQFREFEDVAALTQRRRGVPITRFSVYRVRGTVDELFDKATRAEAWTRFAEGEAQWRRVLPQGGRRPTYLVKDCLVPGITTR